MESLLGFPTRFGALIAVLLGLGAFSPVAGALGLGPLKVESNLGQPLRATAPVQLGSSDAAADLAASLASSADYRMVGKPRQPIVDAVKINLVDGEPPTIVLTSTRPIQDPLFQVLVRVGDGDNQVLKMYTVALDPPRAAPPRSQTSAADESADRTPRSQSRELPAELRQQRETAEAGPAVDRPAVQETQGWAKRDKYGPVRSGDTVTTIAQRLRRDDSVPIESAVVALWKANPQAFIDGNVNLLRKGAVLEVPEESAVRRYSAGEAEQILKNQRQEWADRGRPQVKTNPGHERYRLKVSLQGSEGNATGAADENRANNDQAADDQGAAAQPESASREEAGEETAGAAGGNGSPGQGGGGSSSAEAADGGETGAASQQVAELQEQIAALRENLNDGGASSEASVAALEGRISELQSQLSEQRSLIAQQSAAMERIANQPTSAGTPARDQYILWLLAGINLLMLVAILALWRKLRQAQPAEAPAAPAPADPEPDPAPADPLTRANAQAASGELKQARSTLWEALAVEPRNWAVYSRLLELYEEEGDADQFEEVARRLMDELGDEQPHWQEAIQQRGRRLKPESPVFAAAATAAVADEAPTFDFEGLDVESGSGGAAENQSAEEAAEEPLSLELPSDTETATDTEEAEREEVAEEPLTFELGDEDRGPDSESQPEEPAGSVEQASALQFAEDDSFPAEAMPFPEEEEEEGPLDASTAESAASAGTEPEAAAEESTETAGPEFALDLAEDGATEPAGEETTSGTVGEELNLELAEPEDEAPQSTGEGLDLELAEREDDGAELTFSLESEEEADEGRAPAEGEASATAEAGEDDGELDLTLDEEGLAEAAGGWEPAAEPELAADDLTFTEPAEAKVSEGGGAQEEGRTAESALDMKELEGLGSLTDEEGWNDDGPLLDFASAEDEAEGETAASEDGQSEDEFEIKLDLAQAWLDMGDPESARGLLQEVQSRGGAEQQERAQRMLAGMD